MTAAGHASRMAAIHMCSYPNMRNRYCSMCTYEREIRSTEFKNVCACPQCCWVTNHAWSGISFLEHDGQPADRVNVVRHCAGCNYEWRQS